MTSPGKPRAGGAALAKTYVAGAVVCALLSAGAYFFGVRPAAARHEEQASRHLELKAARKKAAALLTARNAAQAQLQSIETALKSQTLRLEPASTVNHRLAKITDLATKDCHLVIDELRPGVIAESGDYQSIQIFIAGSGTYPNCAKFLHRLRQKFPDTAVRSFETTNNSASPDAPAATFQFELAWHAAKG